MKKAKPSAKKGVNPMWGGHYATGPAAIMEKINTSIGFDKKLYREDIAGSIAHAQMLGKQKILSDKEAKTIVSGLNTILKEIESDKFVFKDSLEDIHMNVESRLAELIGDAAGKLHTARSRNDQVALDFRLYVKRAANEISDALAALQHALIARAEEHAATIMPGFTHLQVAQPVTLGHHLLAYTEMFHRDRTRFLDALERMDECPLGAAALAGTSFPIDRNATAKALGFRAPTPNSLDSVSSRDFALEFLAAAAICAVHLSRLAEEMVIWSSTQFGFIKFSEKFTSGSSIMPQKRNPDAAELVRGKSGRIIGNLTSLLITLKGLSLAYNKDMQEDKEPVFDTQENILLCIHAMTGLVGDFTANKERMLTAAGEGYSTATDLADWLVRTLGVPFRKAHHITGSIVNLAQKKNKKLHELALADMQTIEPKITKEVFSVLSVENSVASRKSLGGTSPVLVKTACKKAKERLK